MKIEYIRRGKAGRPKKQDAPFVPTRAIRFGVYVRKPSASRWTLQRFFTNVGDATEAATTLRGMGLKVSVAELHSGGVLLNV